MDNESITELFALLGQNFAADLKGEKMPKPKPAVTAPANPGRAPDTLKALQQKAYRETQARKQAAERALFEKAALDAARKKVYGSKPRDVFSGPPRGDAVSKAYVDALPPPPPAPLMSGPAVVVGGLVATDNSKDLARVQDANLRLVRRVNSLENSRVGVGCAKATVGAAALFLFVTAVLVGATLALAYAEHQWDVPVFTRIVKGR